MFEGDPNGPAARHLCNNIYDTQGCNFNAHDKVSESSLVMTKCLLEVLIRPLPLFDFREHSDLWFKCIRHCSDSGSFHDDL